MKSVKVHIKNKTNICIQDINSFYKMDGCYKWPYSKVYIHAKKRNKKKKKIINILFIVSLIMVNCIVSLADRFFQILYFLY